MPWSVERDSLVCWFLLPSDMVNSIISPNKFANELGEGGYVVCYEMDDIKKKLGLGRNSLVN